MKRLTILAAGLSTLIAAPALAGGLAEPAPGPVTIAPAPVAATGIWTGFSVGGQLGYGDVSTSGPALSGSDYTYGLRAYYDYDFGDFIVGGGLQYDNTDIDLGGVTSVDSVTRLGLRAGVDLGPELGLRHRGPRAGPDVQPRRWQQRRLVRPGCRL